MRPLHARVAAKEDRRRAAYKKMLSYQHGYHAGGLADIHKHVALSVLLKQLVEKDKPFVVIDLHAGHGVYDLGSPAAKKTNESAGGAGRLWERRADGVPASVAAFLTHLESANPDGRLTRYPGSPALARAVLRADDRLILNELHPTALADLKRWAGRDTRIAVHSRDAMEALLGLTPPAVRRGIVVIDPSYEVKTEYAAIPEAVKKAVRKWAQGMYLVWYPILPDGRHLELIGGMERGLDADILCCELMFESRKPAKDRPGLRGTGLVVVNPPWRFDAQMDEAGTWIAKKLTAAGRHGTRWLRRKPERA